eukprot:TRINITY_DN4176_c0_g1_i9.p1 TRINITY_DN4176_c0_g1~~TRINITY_DN4176_c0_g1_i9.p1  ORF type:complete len:1084 (-),score=198.37 TRINITY_DN4176_c0_g1_i9:67-3318(-)
MASVRKESVMAAPIVRERSSITAAMHSASLKPSRKRVDSVLAKGPLGRKPHMPKPENDFNPDLVEKDEEQDHSSSKSSARSEDESSRRMRQTSPRNRGEKHRGATPIDRADIEWSGGHMERGLSLSSIQSVSTANEQQSLPPSIRSLLETFPHDLLVRMPKLNLTNESVIEFPKIIFRFKQLESLDISHNSIQSIPAKEIARHLPFLKSLNLGHNHLHDVFDLMHLASLSKLSSLDLRGNPIAYVNQRVYLVEALIVTPLRQGKYRDYTVQDLLQHNSSTKWPEKKSDGRVSAPPDMDVEQIIKKKQFISPALSKLYEQLSSHVDIRSIEEAQQHPDSNGVYSEQMDQTGAQLSPQSQMDPRFESSSKITKDSNHRFGNDSKSIGDSHQKPSTLDPISTKATGLSSPGQRPTSANTRARLSPIAKKPIPDSVLKGQPSRPIPQLSTIIQQSNGAIRGGPVDVKRYNEKDVSDAISTELRPSPIPRSGGPFRSLSELNGSPITIDEVKLASEEIKLDMKTWKRKFESDRKITRIASRTTKLSPDEVARKEFLAALLEESNFTHRTHMQLVQYEKMRQSRKRDEEDKELDTWVEQFIRNGRLKHIYETDEFGVEHKKPSELQVDEESEELTEEIDDLDDDDDHEKNDQQLLLRLSLAIHDDPGSPNSPKDYRRHSRKTEIITEDRDFGVTSEMRENETVNMTVKTLDTCRRLRDEVNETIPMSHTVESSADELSYQLQRHMLHLNHQSDGAEVQLSSKSKRNKIKAKVDFTQIIRSEFLKSKVANTSIGDPDFWKGHDLRQDWGTIVSEAPQVDQMIDALHMLQLKNNVDFCPKQPKEIANLSEKAIKTLIFEDNKRIDEEAFRQRIQTLRQNLRSIATRKSETKVDSQHKKLIERAKYLGREPDQLITQFEEEPAKTGKPGSPEKDQVKIETDARAGSGNAGVGRRPPKMIPPLADEKKVQLPANMGNKDLVLACARLRTTMKKDLQELADARDQFIDNELEFEEKRHDEMYLIRQFLERKYASEKIVQIGEDEYQYSKLFSASPDRLRKKAAAKAPVRFFVVDKLELPRLLSAEGWISCLCCE